MSISAAHRTQALPRVTTQLPASASVVPAASSVTMFYAEFSADVRSLRRYQAAVNKMLADPKGADAEGGSVI